MAPSKMIVQVVLLLVLVLHVGQCDGWPFRRDRVSPRMQKMLSEAVEAARDKLAAEHAAPPSSIFDFFLSPNTTRLERKDWGKHLALAFENFRVPAALVAGTALSGAFALSPTSSDLDGEALAKRVYHLLSIASFISSMLTVALATSALVQLNERDSGRNSEAENLEDFISRAGFALGQERWIAVNTHFILGILSLCAAVALRCYISFADRVTGQIAAMIVASGALTAVSFGLPNGVGLSLVARHTTVILRRVVDLRSPSPMLMLAVALAMGAAWRTVMELLLPLLIQSR